jgi:hypothetical protein
MHRPPAIDRRELILTGLAATLAAVAAPSLVMAATPKLRVSNAKALGGIRRVMIGSFGMNFVTERKASQSIGGGFRSKGGTANVNVQTTLAGLRSADYQAAADAGYAAAIKALGAAGIEVADNKDLLASLLAKVRAQPGGDEDSFSEGNKSSVKMVRYGATPFGGFVPLDGWATMGGGFSGLRNMGALQAGLAATAHLKAYAKANNIAILGVLITVNPVKMTKEQGSEWRVPDAFGYGGLARTNSISTETGLSSNPFKTWLDVYPASGGTGQFPSEKKSESAAVSARWRTRRPAG